MKTLHTLSTTELRWLVSELNTERARLDRALALADFDPKEIAVGVHTETAARRDALVAALDRIGAGTYGACERCYQDIPYGRLMVVPEATLCVACLAGS
ncbi:TraR/DksA family transcriptional regulator [Gemmatimonas groenlandica]|uniref:Zinc finger DksA/TraR C4-type domain-containing protein n=1 Tax=Gemmatimonas groenlandica TaxID=2732249 RepID=A0A6M4IQU7_9BACT|nr:TraR/DksA C4-type zinc finger protein [Gemmatimonas groenlandica]QJR35837.1 hypothetical protein HKW67_10100 [Gemmatimonas groenlandica]